MVGYFEKKHHVHVKFLWGSHFFTANHDNLGEWSYETPSLPEIFESPRLFRHGNDIFMIARTDPRHELDKKDHLFMQFFYHFLNLYHSVRKISLRNTG